MNDPNGHPEKLALKATPNPFNRSFTLSVEGPIMEYASIWIIDALGQIVIVYKANLNGANRLEIGQELIPVIYWIQLLNSGQMVNIRIVKSGN